MDEPIAKKEDFASKYSEAGIIGKTLIDNFYRNIDKLLINADIKQALEVGCGHGYSTHYLAKSLGKNHIEASEFDECMIPDAKTRNPGVLISQESIYQLQREENSFDLVLALEVLEHLEDPNKALEELQRVTSRYCIVSVPREPLWRCLNMARGKYLKDMGNTTGHINHWSKKKFIHLVRQYFERIKVLTPLPWTIILAEHPKH
ncbi:MAG: class I SAM-dependent methyltransferase [Opitutaceae bacterium]|nr:class I SAM-dependent methyltransferase [Opitutaceae bacterium]